MLRAFAAEHGHLMLAQTESLTAPLSSDIIWADLLDPSPEEDRAVEQLAGIDIPSREDMMEIQLSNRLYHEGGATFTSASFLVGVASNTPTLVPVSFIVSGERLVTVRYAEPRSFVKFLDRVCRPNNGIASAEQALVELLEAMVNRTAEIMSGITLDIDGLSLEVFNPSPLKKTISTMAMREMMRRMGYLADLLSKLRESLVTQRRMLAFLIADFETRGTDTTRYRLKSLTKDVEALADYAGFSSQKVGLLLDAMVGLIGIEQNGIIKIFSVASVVFLPPTLVASIYGMNFSVMPELHWLLGYPYALVMMVLSAVLPFFYFRHKGWL